MPSFDSDVIIAGAGPVGLLTALRLAQKGISVTLVEALPEIVDSPRAAVYRGPALLELVAAGIFEDVLKKGIKTTDIAWRRIHAVKDKDGKEIFPALSEIAKIDSGKFFVGGHKNECITLGQYGLSEILREHLAKLDNFKMHFSSPVTAIDQDEESITVSSNDKRYRAKYMVGCDGGRSGCRKLLGIKAEGYTMPYPVVANNVYYDFMKHGFGNGQYFVDKDHFALIARLDDKGLWRVSYGEKEGMSEEEMCDPKRVAEIFEILFPGPRPLEYKCVSSRSYMMHQRCCDTFRKGRALLAGDAARLNNPFGGLGLTGGILDGGAAAEALIAVLLDGESDKILDRYSEIRRKIFLEYNNKWSIDNVKLLRETEPEVAHEHPVLKGINSTSDDEFRKSFLDDHCIRHSMIREYQQPDKKAMREAEQKKAFDGFEIKEF